MPPSTLRSGFLTELSVAGRKMRTLFDGVVRERGLNLARARLMLQLGKHEPVNQTELAAMLELEHPTIVRLLDGLEKQDLILRSAVDGDRRAKQVTLTAPGRAQAAQLDDLVAALRDTLLHDITEEELAVASRVLGRIIRNIEAQPAGSLAGDAADERR
ncbi:MarR family transcriptional regulator [Roseomonas aerophila]|uniref:MarR family transcriptional regulator n=1 Tax=Teichococcus aerophilus TaxID=1224513 RepID=A0ABR7RNF6_9PROT|nr:MarR family transcriptional regulator [Pseudoroseomonas aerophila]MBC9207627.1 MarR family transcriptional regulator [Pseudoroseomonas aerophila]